MHDIFSNDILMLFSYYGIYENPTIWYLVAHLKPQQKYEKFMKKMLVLLWNCSSEWRSIRASKRCWSWGCMHNRHRGKRLTYSGNQPWQAMVYHATKWSWVANCDCKTKMHSPTWKLLQLDKIKDLPKLVSKVLKFHKILYPQG